MNDLIALVVAAAICFGAAAVGGYATTRSLRDWYVALPKPSWNPPSWVFGPVWTVLYGAMAVAVWLVWRARDERDVTVAFAWFAAQLVLNVAWSVVFFGMRAPKAALGVILGLWLAILGTILVFAPISMPAAAILVPYLLWVTFAAGLNGAIVRKASAAG